MRRTKIASRKFRSGCVVASSRQTVRDFGFPLRVARGLLHDNPLWANVEAEAQHLGPEACAGSLAMDSGSDACSLAGWSSNDNIGGNTFKRSNVAVDSDAGEQMGKETLPAGLDLDELHGAEIARGVEAKGVTADIAEKVEDIHNSILR